MRRTVGLGAGLGAVALVVATLPAVGAGWTPTEAPEVVVDTTPSKTDLAVGATSHGEAIVLWSESGSSEEGGTTALMASVREAGEWGTPEQLDVGLGNQAVLGAHVLIDSTGFATVIWIRRYPSAGPNKLWFATRPAGGDWSTAAEVSPGLTGTENLSAAMTPGGAITAAWQSSGGGISAADKAPGGTTWTVGPVSVAGLSPAVAAAPDGTTAIAWGSNGLLKVKVRSGTGPWADVTTEDGSADRPETPELDTAGEPVIAFGPDNQLHAAWWEYEDPGQESPEQVRTSSRSAAGTWTVHPDAISDSNTTTQPSGIAADASGNVTVVWPSIQFSPFETRYFAATRVDGTWEAPYPLSGDNPVSLGSEPRLTVTPGGMFTVVWGQDAIRANRRTADGAWLEAPEILSATNSNFLAAGADSTGDPIAVWKRGYVIQPSEFHSVIETRTFDPNADPGDTGGPVTTLIRPNKPYYLSPTIPVEWTAEDPEGSPLAGTRVRQLAAPWNGDAEGDYTNLTTFGSGTLFNATGDPGYTYCFQAQTQDDLLNAGDWSAPLCTATPVDDRQAKRAGTWKKLGDARFYRGTALQSKDKGATLTLNGAKAARIALVVSKGPGFGKLKVKFAEQTFGPYSLNAKKGKRKVVIPVVEFDFFDPQTGKLVVKVVSKDGKKVVVDGILVGRV